MSKNFVDEKVKDAILSTKPNYDFDKILAACVEADNNKIIDFNSEKRNTTMNKKLIGIAAMLTLLIGGGGYFGYMNAEAYTIELDVNPSISITVANSGKISKVTAKNNDATAIVNTADVVGEELDDGLEAIFENMAESGYVDANSNSVLITISGNTNVELANEILDIVDMSYEKTNVESAIIIQNIDDIDDEIEVKAGDNEISYGKAKVISELIAADNSLVFEELAKLSINELNLLTQSANRNLSDMTIQVGTPSGYVDVNKAIDSALMGLGLSNSDAHDLEIEYEYENGVLYYEVEFNTQDKEHKYYIDAVTGELLDFNPDDLDDINDADDDDDDINDDDDDDLDDINDDDDDDDFDDINDDDDDDLDDINDDDDNDDDDNDDDDNDDDDDDNDDDDDDDNDD